MSVLRKYFPLLMTLAVLVLLFVVASVLYPRFASPLVVANILRGQAFLGILAIGMTFVILSGGIDLSVGTVLAFTTILIAKLVSVGWHPVFAILLGLGIGGLFGAMQGAVIEVYRLPPFLVTLAGLFFAKGMAFLVHLQSMSIRHEWFSAVAGFRWNLFENAPVTVPTIVFAGVTGIAIVGAHFTGFGRNVYAIGGNETSALLMGLPVSRTKIGVYAISGFCAALGGVVYAFGTTSGDPSIGLGFELDAIACAVIGGTLLMGGVGYVAGTFLGVLIFGTIKTVLDFGSLDSAWLRIAMGGLLLIFIVVQRSLVGRKAV